MTTIKCILILLLSSPTSLLLSDSVSVAHLFVEENKTAVGIHKPASVEELQRLIIQAAQQKRRVTIVGSAKSMGGQTHSNYDGAYRISLKKMNKMILLDVRNKEATVETGMTWFELQRAIVPHGLTVRAMQSYSDFSIGGSLSVNVHGQDLSTGQLIRTVRSFRMINAQGELIEVSRTKNQKLFALAIGGYGLFGVITDVTLSLADDLIMERKAQVINASQVAEYFQQHIQHNQQVEFFSARLSLGKANLLDKALIVTYNKTTRETPRGLEKDRKDLRLFACKLFVALKKFPSLQRVRFPLESKFFQRESFISRNNFMNGSIKTLPQDTDRSHYILQEYFIPYDTLNEFIDTLRSTIRKYDINMLNISLRHVHADTVSKLTYAPQDCCALVLYVHLPQQEASYMETQAWTRKLIDAAIECKGCYYLPYHLLATDQQIRAAYPAFDDFLEKKRKYDPTEMFTNKLYERYAHKITAG